MSTLDKREDEKAARNQPCGETSAGAEVFAGLDAEPSGALTRDEFCGRFVSQMLSVAGNEDGLAEYAAQAAAAAWEDPLMREDGPEECALTDMSYWED
jgi:hypothetical protein